MERSGRVLRSQATGWPCEQCCRPARHRLAILAAGLSIGLSACSAPEPVPVTLPGERAGAAVVRKPAAPAVSMPVEARASAAALAPHPAIVVPAGSQYVCVTEADGMQSQTAVAFAPKVAQLCLRHPEMGPCQYERNLCRRSGGRVYAADGEEITMATEAEYDRHVLRVRFKSN